jgi:glycosyltransferase involved in cell wall biosynthesis
VSLRVLVVGDLASPHSTRWADAMVDRGHEVLRAGFGTPSESRAAAVELGSREVSDRRYAAGLPRLGLALRRFKPDVVHAHFVASYGVMATVVAGRTPIIAFAWGSDVLWLDRYHRAHQKLIGWSLRRAEAIVVDAADVGDRVRGLAPETPVTQAVFGPERSWTEAGRQEEPRVLSPRLLKDFYNIGVIIEAFARACVDRPDWMLDVLTNNGDTTDLEAHVARLGMAERVVFWPRLDRAELQQRFLHAAIVCSVPSSDATSVALLEAMASGAVPIVSDLPANRAWVDDGRSGLVVPAGDVAALAAAIGRAIDDDELRRVAREANRRLIADTASWETAVDRIDALTLSSVQEARSRRRRAATHRTTS